VEDPDTVRLEPQKKSLHADEQTRPDVAQRRQAWQASQPDTPAEQLIFLDETWASTDMTPTRGRAPIGKRCLGRAPYGHWKTTTFVCALRTTGLVAPLVLDGPINGQTFRAWVEQMLVPTLRPGDVVVLDNLGSHKVSGIAEAIQAAGAQLRYLPPYSPDFNPIEQVFAKLKTLLRKAATRTVETLWDAIGNLLDRFPSHECERYICHAGYGKSA
jgi:transposase